MAADPAQGVVNMTRRVVSICACTSRNLTLKFSPADLARFGEGLLEGTVTKYKVMLADYGSLALCFQTPQLA